MTEFSSTDIDTDDSFYSATMSEGNTITERQPTPPAPQGLEIRQLEFTIHIPDLLNGDVAKVTQAAPKASIGRAYKWPVIRALPPQLSIDAVEFIIRANYAHLVSSAGNSVTDAIRVELRRKAIVLGAIRAGATAAYKLMSVDMNTDECVAAGAQYASGRISQDTDGQTAAPRWTIMTGMEAFDPTEVGVIGVLVYLGMAVPVLQGASLVNTGHHYLPTTKNIFAGQKRQALGLATEAGRQWIEALGETFDDMAFHKACHPISPPRKRTWAKKQDVAQRLLMSGHGAAAIRLPAIPSDAAIGKTAIALANAARATIRSMGHTIQVTEGTQLIGDLEAADEGAEERECIQNIQFWATAHMSQLAFCAGIVQHLHETTGSGRNTLLSAYSVKKLMSDQAAQVQLGVTYARVAAQKNREAMESGNFRDPMIIM
jgi:hypothetical protein